MEFLHTPEAVRRYAEEGRLEEWIHAFLRSVGGNVPLSDGLRLQPRYWVGPVCVPLQTLTRCCGPEETMEYVMPADNWERRMSFMGEGLSGGWNPPPLVAQYRPEGVFSLRDGNHRHEALRRSGAQAWWCVVWCDTEELRQEAIAQLSAHGVEWTI